MMHLLGKIANPRLMGCVAGMVLLFFCLVSTAVAFNGTDFITGITNPQDMGKLHQLIGEYQDKLVDTDQEIFDIQENMAWLGIKIKSMEDAKRHVPESMENSMVHKRSRIDALSKEKDRYESRLKELKALEDHYLKYLKSNKLETEENGFEPDPDAAAMGNDKKEAFQRGLQLKIADAGLGDWVELVDDGGCCRMETRLPILFPSGKAEIAAEYHPFLKGLAELVKAYDVRIFVGGFADIDRIHTTKYASNFELGALRAANVVHALVKYGVKPSVFQVGSTGRYRFKAKGMSSKKTLERRVDLTVVFAG